MGVEEVGQLQCQLYGRGGGRSAMSAVGGSTTVSAGGGGGGGGRLNAVSAVGEGQLQC